MQIITQFLSFKWQTDCLLLCVSDWWRRSLIFRLVQLSLSRSWFCILFLNVRLVMFPVEAFQKNRQVELAGMPVGERSQSCSLSQQIKRGKEILKARNWCSQRAHTEGALRFTLNVSPPCVSALRFHLNYVYKHNMVSKELYTRAQVKVRRLQALVSP